MDEHNLDLVRAEFRRLSVADPKEARTLFFRCIEHSHEGAGSLISGLSEPGDGRARQLVASALRGHADFRHYRPQLEKWLEKESDEFARRAIRAAIDDGSQNPKSLGRASPVAERDAYRYVSDRMQHEVRNGLYAPKAGLLRLKNIAASLDDTALKAEISAAIASVEEGMVTIGRLVEFQDGDEDFFKVRPITLAAWLREMQRRYVYKCGPMELKLSGDGTVSASDHLLRLIFWNLWSNAHRLLKASCRVEVSIQPHSKNVVVRVSDNGVGFDADQAEMMFQNNVAKEAHRGRGLQEVYDAVLRLRGSARAVADEQGAFRLEISLPKG